NGNNSPKTRSFHPDSAFIETFFEEPEGLDEGSGKVGALAKRAGPSTGERVTFVWRAPSGLPKEAKALKALTAAAGELASLEERYESERLLYVALTRAKGRLVLPFYTSGPDPRPLAGAYGVLDNRLR